MSIEMQSLNVSKWLLCFSCLIFVAAPLWATKTTSTSPNATHKATSTFSTFSSTESQNATNQLASTSTTLESPNATSQTTTTLSTFSAFPTFSSESVCRDVASDCYKYGHVDCVKNGWVMSFCERFCGICDSTDTAKEPCSDTSYCRWPEHCVSSYQKWGYLNCRRYCGYCDSVTETENCEDRDLFCYVPKYCIEPYVQWGYKNCRQFCGYCDVPSREENTCEDNQGDCYIYDPKYCYGPYAEWGYKKCQRFCGYCEEEMGCEDISNRCSWFGHRTCSPEYERWAWRNCRKYCGYCNATTLSMLNTSVVTSVVTSTRPTVSTQNFDIDYLGSADSKDTNRTHGEQSTSNDADSIVIRMSNEPYIKLALTEILLLLKDIRLVF